jgi:NAD(P)H-dependent FMN reductase
MCWYSGAIFIFERRIMPTAPKVVVIVGSLRKESFNRKTANAMIALKAAPLEYEFAEIGNQPLYNQDLDTDNPPADGRPCAAR